MRGCSLTLPQPVDTRLIVYLTNGRVVRSSRFRSAPSVGTRKNTTHAALTIIALLQEIAVASLRHALPR